MDEMKNRTEAFQRAVRAVHSFGYAYHNMFRVRRAEYFDHAGRLGYDRAKAEFILRREQSIASASPDVPALDAIDRATRHLKQGFLSE